MIEELEEALLGGADEAAFLAHVKHIEKTYKGQPTLLLMSMAGALLGIGKRSKKLHAAALRVANRRNPRSTSIASI